MSVILTRFTTLFYHTRFLSSSLTYCIKIKSLCFITFPNIDKGVQNIMCRRVTLMKFEVFGKVIKHCFTSISSIKAKLLSIPVQRCPPVSSPSVHRVRFSWRKPFPVPLESHGSQTHPFCFLN